MSQDKTTPTIGKILETEMPRDAVHFAVAPVIASQTLHPGQHINLMANGEATFNAEGKPIGIVDPFLMAPVYKGQRFWMFLYPGSIISLRHEWMHPAFGAQPSANTAKSIKWIEDLADRLGFNYADLLERGREAITTGSAHGGDDSTAESLDNVKEEFLRHVSIVTDTPFPENFRTENVYFSCAC